MILQSVASPVLDSLENGRLPSANPAGALLQPLARSSQYVSHSPSLEGVDRINRGAFTRTKAVTSGGEIYCWSLKRRRESEGREGYLVFKAAEDRFNIYRSSDVERAGRLSLQALAAGEDERRFYVIVTSTCPGVLRLSAESGYAENLKLQREVGAFCLLDTLGPGLEIMCEFEAIAKRDIPLAGYSATGTAAKMSPLEQAAAEERVAEIMRVMRRAQQAA